LFAVFSASALGAGKPVFPSSGHGIELTYAHVGPNHAEIAASVSPNGAATTLSVQYREVGATEWITAGTKEVGSGTETVQFLVTIMPIVQGHKYEAQAVATNSYGTVTTAEKYGGTYRFNFKWIIAKSGGINTSSYIAPGTFQIEWQRSGYNLKLECNQSGAGEFGPEAVSESLEVTLSGCTYHFGNLYECHPKGSYIIWLDNTFYTNKGFNMEFCPGEEFVLSSVEFPNRFFVTGSATNNNDIESYEAVHPITMTTQGLVTGKSATVTSSSNWQLTGAFLGKNFALSE
jgi:hypothetical protein